MNETSLILGGCSKINLTNAAEISKISPWSPCNCASFSWVSLKSTLDISAKQLALGNSQSNKAPNIILGNCLHLHAKKLLPGVPTLVGSLKSVPCLSILCLYVFINAPVNRFPRPKIFEMQGQS